MKLFSQLFLLGALVASSAGTFAAGTGTLFESLTRKFVDQIVETARIWEKSQFQPGERRFSDPEILQLYFEKEVQPKMQPKCRAQGPRAGAVLANFMDITGGQYKTARALQVAFQKARGCEQALLPQKAIGDGQVVHRLRRTHENI